MKRYIAHITIEADTPLKVGSNHSDFLQDAPVQKDWNGLPMILGTSIAGVLRKEFDGDTKEIFGEENGSKVIFSNALLVDKNDKVYEELLLDLGKLPFLKIFENLPIREHTAISHKGVAKEHSKFDEEVVYKGTRFRFSIEMLDDEQSFNEILDLLGSPTLRLGGGSTKGFGKFKIVQIKKAKYDKSNYDTYSSSLNGFEGETYTSKKINSNYAQYLLRIKPDDFFMFGSGFGDKDADMTQVYERVVDYEKIVDNNEKGSLSDEMILIPASSIKGAISHRVAYHYNKSIGATIESGNAKVGEDNEAVKAIFGRKKELADDGKTELGLKGRVLMSDCYKPKADEKVFDHVSIDRFTGGAIDGALFQEKTVADKSEYEIEILLDTSINGEKLKAFEATLNDICSGMLPLGGATTKGHGVFSGTWSKS